MTRYNMVVESRTKIVATLGPASEEPGALAEMLRAGVDVVRVNLSHGDLDEHVERIDLVRRTAQQLGLTIGVLADLPGPKVRTGRFAEGGVVLAAGDYVRLAPGEGPSDAQLITVDYPSLLDDVRPGDSIVIGDGAISMHVAHAAVGEIGAVVVTGGKVQGRPGVHLPAERLRLAAPTPHDLQLAAAMTEVGVDFLAVSFVRCAEDLHSVRQVTGDDGPRLVAKIETAPAVGNLAEILAATDAVMVARGDLGIECPLEDLPHLQKQIIRSCVEAGVPVITATQMLESMITSPSPTRAEITDVANAVFDGTDAVMLSGETAIGSDPALVVRTMQRIAARAEIEADYGQWGARLGRVVRNDLPSGPERTTMAITHAAFQAAADIGVAAILCCTRSGRTARAMSSFRPGARLVGLSPDAASARALTVSWGVHPMVVDTYHSTDELVWFAVERAVADGVVRSGQDVLVLAGAPDRPSRAATDVLRVVTVG